MQIWKWAYNFQSIALPSSESDIWVWIRGPLRVDSGSLSSTIPQNVGRRAGRLGGGVLCQMTFIFLNDSD